MMAKHVNEESPVRLAIVGHTNTGKTSLIRTLLRDENFGEINDEAGTTRYVEKTSIYAEDREVLTLFDTPGFEDSSALLGLLEQIGSSIDVHTPMDVLHHFLQQSEQHPDFIQEAKVIRQAIHSDVLLYIIDVREPLLGKYRDEVEILNKTGKPILPVFNFIAGNNDGLERWRAQMARYNLHAALEFDSVAFSFEAEKRLYQKLQSLLESRYESLQSLIDYRQTVWQKLTHAAVKRILKMLIEVVSYRMEVDATRGAAAEEIATMQDYVRNVESKALSDMLKIFAFTQVDVDLQQLPVKDGEWTLDIFSPHALKEFGQTAGASALKGATAGAGIDLMVGGMSLGAAAALGAILGAGFSTVKRYQRELKAAFSGNKWLGVNDETINVLYLRQRDLLHTLTHRGHAAQGKLQLGKNTLYRLPKGWSGFVDTIRHHPEWMKGDETDPDYLQVQSQFTNWVLQDNQSSVP